MPANRVARGIGLALRRAKVALLLSVVAYLLPLLLGIAAVSAGMPFAVHQRDSIVASAQRGPTLSALNRGDRVEAALLDFGSNLVLGAAATSLTGICVVCPFPLAAYRGWVGGVVSIDHGHRSRLTQPSEAGYYLLTLLLQLTGYILSMAAGLHVGLAAWRSRGDTSLRSWLGLRIPGWSLRDAGWLYLPVVPVMLAGSLWEFLAA
jgi:hypothetical protein